MHPFSLVKSLVKSRSQGPLSSATSWNEVEPSPFSFFTPVTLILNYSSRASLISLLLTTVSRIAWNILPQNSERTLW